MKILKKIRSTLLTNLSKLDKTGIHKISFFYFLIFPHIIFAQTFVQNSTSTGQAATVGDVASNLTAMTGIFEGLFTTVFYAIGIAFVMASLMRYREHRMNPSQTPIGRVIFLLLTGLAIGFFPIIIKFLGKYF